MRTLRRPTRRPKICLASSAILNGSVLVAVAFFLAGGRGAWAQLAVTDDFEAGAFAPAWGQTAGVALPSGAGAGGSAHFAQLAAFGAATGRELGARLDRVAPGGARDFDVDFRFRIQATANRQFHLHVSTAATAIGSSAPALSLRYQAGWAAYDGGAWQPIAGLGSVATGLWYRARVSGQGWGLPGARYGVALSDADGTNFTSAVTNLTWYQGGTPSANTARYFVFTTVYGSNPGFDVDMVTATVTAAPQVETNAIINISGTYPHLAVFGTDGEIGIGAVAPWADRLWFITYPPHQPNGSPDKLWTVDPNLTLTARAESMGGTHANRLIHRESRQLIMGSYFIGTNGAVRAIAPAAMPGRLTATARHLTDPANKVCFATMEEGFYAVDVNTLAVTTLKADAQTQTAGAGLLLAGSHGKGFYSGQGRYVYANNGEAGWGIAGDPGFIRAAGLLAENTGTSWSSGWTTLERKCFTEVTGPGGLLGATNDGDPLWALGWDKRSVILKLLDGGTWRTYRLPKGSYTHDAFHGWYTEWPRIREIVDGRLLMHMHGLFYTFPKTFSAANTAGIEPLCTYLKMPVDYCWWNGRLVMGRDDASATGGNTWAGQSHSAPWFGQLADLGDWGPPAGFGGPWKADAVTAGTPSEPFLVRGFRQRVLHLRQAGGTPLNIALEVDRDGSGAWQTLTNLAVAAGGYAWQTLPPALAAAWVRLVPDADATNLTAYLHLANPPRTPAPELFAGIADAAATAGYSDGILRPQTGDARTLQVAATVVSTNGVAATAYYEITGALQLRRATNATAEATLRTTYGLAAAGFTHDAASVIYTEGANRFRLPKSLAAYDAPFASGWPRGVREVVTERQLFQAHGTFYELPLAASGGFRRVRPVTTHRKHISDFGSWRGLFVIAGVAAGVTNSGHVFRSADGQAALWFGNVDDLWRMGAPAGVGGPWRNAVVTNNVASDPYLMFGYERKVLELSHAAAQPVTFTVEVDFAADNTWSAYGRFTVPPGETVTHVFPAGYSAHWVRLRADADTTATATFTYGAAAPRVTGTAVRPDGSFELTVSVPTGPAYAVQASTNLATWTTLATNPAPPAPFTWADPAAANFAKRYYRVLPEPQ